MSFDILIDRSDYELCLLPERRDLLSAGYVRVAGMQRPRKATALPVRGRIALPSSDGAHADGIVRMFALSTDRRSHGPADPRCRRPTSASC
jgi:hypothetical protein